MTAQVIDATDVQVFYETVDGQSTVPYAIAAKWFMEHPTQTYFLRGNYVAIGMDGHLKWWGEAIEDYKHTGAVPVYLCYISLHDRRL